jgi:uncharacterized protein (DUF2147 family)
MRLSVSLAAAAALLSTPAFSDTGMSGHWTRGDGAARVRISPCGASMCAVNTWVKNKNGGEKVGDRLVMTLNSKSPSVLSGTAHDPQRSLTYAIEVRVNGRSMTTRGCVLGGMVCKNMGWSKAN